jgi:S1-C subfamily serine protease
MKYFILFLLFIQLGIFAKNANAQAEKSNSFEEFINGQKYAYIVFPDELCNKIKVDQFNTGAFVLSGVQKYLYKLGFLNVKWGSISEFNMNDIPSYCNLTRVFPTWDVTNKYLIYFKLTYFDCLGHKYEMELNKDIDLTTSSNIIINNIFNGCMSLYRNSIDSEQSVSLKLPKELTEWTETSLRRDYFSKGHDSFEGIYEISKQNINEPNYKLAVVKSNKGYNIIYLTGANNYLDWQEGEIKATLESTAIAGTYKANWVRSDKILHSDAFVTFNNGILTVSIGSLILTFIKTFPNNANEGRYSSSGSGFAISSNGFIATNHHVIDNAFEINIRGINGDFSKAYPAEIIADDKNNDLAILRIKNPNERALGDIPYDIKLKGTDVGATIFAMGYPLRNIMGDEVKVTNGIISSKSGFQGNLTLYQISASVQPGNSGGPLFDSYGSVIGIVNAKIIKAEAENVSYAVKSSYLLNLIDNISELNNNILTSKSNSKSIVDQVKLFKNFIYIIEVK